MTTFSSIVDALPNAAHSPLALVAYAMVVTAWAVLGWRIRRNRNLLAHLEKLPEKDRLEALRLEMGEQSLKTALNAEQWLRARIHKFVLIGFSILCLAVVLVFAIAGATAKGQIGVSIGTYTEPLQSLAAMQMVNSITYTYKPTDSGIAVLPVFPYRDRARSGEEMEGLEFESIYEPFYWSLPRLSIKISNNSDQTVYVTELAVDVLGNQVDLAPLLYVHPKSYQGHFAIHNEGWGAVKEPRLLLSFQEAGGCDKPARPQATTRVQIAEFDERADVDLSPLVPEELKQNLLQCTNAIASRCTNGFCRPGDFRKLKCADSEASPVCTTLIGKDDEKDVARHIAEANRYRGKRERLYTRDDIVYKRNCDHLPMCVRGKLEYRRPGSSAPAVFRFKKLVSLGPEPYGAYRPPAHSYELFIKAGQSGDTLMIPVSHELKPGESDHLLLTVASDKSADMELILRVLNSEKKQLAREKVKLGLVLPRSSATLLDEKASALHRNGKDQARL